MQKIRVVIVEDEFVIAEDMRLWLEQHNYEVDSVFDRAEIVLPYVLSQPPDILLVDIKLLGPMDGIELVERMQQKVRIPVIYITANSDTGTYQRARGTNPNAFLIKPFALANLLPSIDLALHNFSSGYVPAAIERPVSKTYPDHQFIIHEWLFIYTEKRYKKISIKELFFVKASGSYLFVVTENEEYILSHNLSEFERKIQVPQLVRMHRSYIININHIDSFSESSVQINEHTIPIGKSYRKIFMDKMLHI